MFVDSAIIKIKAGNGGNGCVSFHREKYINAGGPDGGDGGKGGDVIFAVDTGSHTLADFRYRRHYKAEPGKDGGSGNKSGKRGEDLVITVPAGTLVREADSGMVIADLTKPGERFVIAKGGRGGRGNQHFATSTRQIPAFAKVGGLGEELTVKLELKLIADVGLIGFPNVGKSTILSMVSSAKPKIANYHFTTIDPNLGVVSLGLESSFVIADIPGLIEGAADGIGLGHDFLKHVERTKLLVHVVDVSGCEGRDPIDDFEKINEELTAYNEKLASRPQLIVANKLDLTGAEDNYEIFKEEMESRGYRVFAASAATNSGLNELMIAIKRALDELPQTVLVDEDEKYVVYQAEEKPPFEVRVEDGVYVVEGDWLYHVVGSTNFGNYESLQHFQKALLDKGVIAELEKHGATEGDTVRMYDLEFDFIN